MLGYRIYNTFLDIKHWLIYQKKLEIFELLLHWEVVLTEAMVVYSKCPLINERQSWAERQWNEVQEGYFKVLIFWKNMHSSMSEKPYYWIRIFITFLHCFLQGQWIIHSCSLQDLKLDQHPAMAFIGYFTSSKLTSLGISGLTGEAQVRLSSKSFLWVESLVKQAFNKV